MQVSRKRQNKRKLKNMCKMSNYAKKKKKY